MLAGSLSKAAELLCISQPAASKMLAHAERSLGMALFTRSRGTLHPTREAELLFAETKGLHERLESVRRLAKNLGSHPGGHLRIGCIPSLAFSLVPQTIAEFVKLCPEVSLDIQTHHTEELCSLLLSREIDVGVAFDPPPRPGVNATELGRAKVVYLSPPGDADTSSEPVELATLGALNWIGLGTADPLGAMIGAKLRELGCEERTPTIEVRTYYLARSLVDCGVGYAIVDEFTARAGRNDPVLRPVSPELSIGVYALVAASNAGSHAQNVLVAQLRKKLKKLKR
jgi:DNA-binding transcriptional LysR family regulator